MKRPFFRANSSPDMWSIFHSFNVLQERWHKAGDMLYYPRVAMPTIYILTETQR